MSVMSDLRDGLKTLIAEIRQVAIMPSELIDGTLIHALADDAEALLVGSPQGEWLPIATAPKDGTWILVQGAGWGTLRPEVSCWSYSAACWQTMGDGLCGVTHWMPFPAPPVVSTPEKAET